MEVLIGNIFESGAQTIVNTVNCVGVMGKGIAAEFKERYPEMFKDYVARCERREVNPGVPYFFKESMFSPQIVNFPTKSDWRAASRIQDIEKGLRILTEKYKEWGIESIALPPLGCGNGQLLWDAVGPLIYKYLSQWDIPVKMYAPYGAPREQLTIDFLCRGVALRKNGTGNSILQKLNPAWVALAEVVYRIERQAYHMPVGRVIFQKIAYVATALGLPTGLTHVRSSYGPYCRELDEVKKRLSNAGLIQEEKSGIMFRVLPGLAYEKDRDKYKENIQNWNSLIDKTVDLFLRLNTNQAEIVATVLFVEKELNHEKNLTEDDVLREVMKWKQQRRPPLNEREVAVAIRNLGVLKWFHLQPSPDLPVDEF
ncbi:MAG: macro domain-containing protein [Candidatus Omnitrophica bacterium]|nr:macro domain-containing protein [Candidatus Omnitrophota bacterium]